MRLFASYADPKLISCLNEGGVVVIPTDTVYGIVAKASNQVAVERIFKLRGRDRDKPFIILVAGHWQITDTSNWEHEHMRLADKYWPGPLSLVVPATSKTPDYLRHPHTHTVAYRVPAGLGLRKLLEATGPLVAPSANLAGQPTAMTLAEAEAYFGDSVDGYVEGGMLAGRAPSTVAAVESGKVKVLRPGALRIL